MRLNNIFIFSFLIIFHYISCNDIYVDNESGENREACGEKESPCRTLMYALHSAQPNDILILKSPFNINEEDFSSLTMRKNVTIRSEDLIPENNIISCYNRDYFVHAESNSNTPLSIQLEGITIQNCGKASDKQGTVIHSPENLDIHIKKCIIKNNAGNAISQKKSLKKLNKVIITSTNFIGNFNSLELHGVNATISDTHFVNNTGANIFRGSVLGGTSLLFELNSGSDYGTGLYFDATTAHLNKCIFRNNTEGRKGILTSFLSKIEIDHSTFENNRVSNNGGAIFLSERSVCTIRNSNFRNNNGAFFGGGIGIESSKVTLIDSKFESNTASKGGAIYVGVNGEAYLYDSEFNKNNASSGAVIYLNHAKYVELKNSKFNQNYATKNGSVVFCRNSIVDIKSNEFNDNIVENREPSKRTDIHCSEEAEDYCDVLGDTDYYRMCYKGYKDDQRKKYIIISVLAISFIVFMVILIIIASVCTRHDKAVKDGYKRYDENNVNDLKEELMDIDEEEDKIDN